MHIRPMTKMESIRFFGNDVHEGFVAVEGGNYVGQIAWNFEGDGEMYVHSLFCDDDYPMLASRLIQKVRQACKEAGKDSVIFLVDVSNPHLMRLVESGRAKIESYLLRMKV